MARFRSRSFVHTFASAGPLLLAVVASCHYDFDQPFSEPPVGTSPVLGPDATDARSDAPTDARSDASSEAASPVDTGVADQGADLEASPVDALEPHDAGDLDAPPDSPEDALTDASSPTCESLGFECVARAPAGWLGPVALLTSGTGPAPACEPPFGSDAFESVASPSYIPPARCSPCTCSAAKGPCRARVQPHCNLKCTSPCAQRTDVAQGVCTEIDLMYFAMALQLQAAFPVAPACEPSVVTVDRPPVEFDLWARGCSGDSLALAGCADSEVCLPAAAEPFECQYCVYRGGYQPCPDDYPSGLLTYRQYEDDRSCESCTCGEPTDVSCGGSVSVTPGSTECTAAPVPFVEDRCVRVGSEEYSRVAVSADLEVTSGECQPAGGKPTGTVTVQDALSICCRPL